MRPLAFALLLAALLTVGGGAAAASPAKAKLDDSWGQLKAPRAYVGAWTLGRDGEGADFCRVQLKPQPTIGGFQLVTGKACAKVAPRWGAFYAWYVKDDRTIVFADPTRAKVLTLSPLVAGVWATEGAEEERLLLQHAGR